MIKIAIPTRDGRVDDHFGHCQGYTIIAVEGEGDARRETGREYLPAPQGCGCKSEIAATLAQMGVVRMLAGNMGDGAMNKLGQSGISVVRGCSGAIDDVLSQWLDGSLADSGHACDHHDCGNHHHENGEVLFRLP